MASVSSVASNASGIKNRLRSATSLLSSPELLPAYMVASSGEVSWIPNEEAEGDFPLLEDAMDREYKTFLNNLSVHGKSYLLEIWMGNPQRLIRLKYEEESIEEGTGYREITDGEKLYGSEKMLDLESPTPCLSKNRCFEKKREATDENKQDFIENVRDNNEIIMDEEEGEEGVEGEEEQEERVQVKQELWDEYEDSLKESSASSMHGLTQDSRISVKAVW